MVQAMIFKKKAGGAVGLFHPCTNESEAWDWVRTQSTDGCNVLVLSDPEDIDLGWLLFGANRRRDEHS